ncbi:hemerythrin domain-containing protein [Anaerococcus sp. Marseille-Q7828]|uniref:hemerythrin domain-containing protein n=1 Tax=Anaerococcus sp. Marseille-Q7828 TaxID=3036300 RepID=UPI0024AD032F|nr:hemerythrin domain-containing protein [Anaerococcus sp. Marseille-Q7828]
MIDSILIDNHKKERNLLFEIDPLLNRILSVHFEHHGGDLIKLHSLFASLKKELEEHFIKEEKITFPLMLANEYPSKELIKGVEALEADNEKAGDLIKEMI